MPPFVGSTILLSWTVLLAQLIVMPSAHSWNVSVPQGPMSFHRMMVSEQVRGPPATCRQDHERGLYERTFSTW